MTYQQVLENARTCIGPYCKACNDCNGKVCRNTMPAVLLEKLGYIAEYEGRTKNRELEQMIKRRIAAFEQEHGEIPIEENDR